jgi:ABC-type nitrate/sulfonate/bicarbonate transport system substrate-binding protein
VDNAAASLPKGNRQLIYSDLYEELSVIATRQQVRERHPQALHTLVRCTVEAARLVQQAPDGGLALAAKAFPDMPAEQLRAQWSEIFHQVGLSNALLSTLGQEAEALVAARPVPTGVPRFADLFAPEFLRAVAPETVTAARRN